MFITNGYSADHSPFMVNADCTVSSFPSVFKRRADATTFDVSAWTWSCATPANAAPVANAGASQTVEQTSAAGAMVTLDGSASSDADGDPLTYRWSGPFGTATGISPSVQFAPGVSNANLVVNDGQVDSEPSTVLITVQDTTPPVVTAPQAVTAEATGTTTQVSLGSASATDLVDGAVAVSSNAPAAFPLGTTTVTWTAKDVAGNVGVATQLVTVVDTTAPSFTLTQHASQLWPVNHKMVLAATLSGLADAVDSKPVLRIVVSSNQGVSANGSGNTSPDWQVVKNGGVWEVWLRAERASPQGDRTYAINATASDAAGNVASQSATVVVPHSQGRM